MKHKEIPSNACREAVEWANKYKSFYNVWRYCTRGDWMLWYLGEKSFDRKRLVLLACKCARLSLKYVKTGEKRPLKAIETAEAWAKNEVGVTIYDVRAVDDAAYVAAYKADTAYAADAANAAACAAYAASNAVYAAHAAHAAAYAAYAANASRTKGQVLAECADIVREEVSAKEAVELGALETREEG